MIKEVLVVEGKMDVVAVKKAVEADCIITGGFTLSERTIDNINQAYQKRGIIILTDPDAAGERIRRFLARRFPNAKHAFVPREEATAEGDVGIEEASPAAIRAALAKVHTPVKKPLPLISAADLIAAGLSGGKEAASRRAALGKILGLGFANAKTFLLRLCHYGVTREEFFAALEEISPKNAAREVNNT